MSEQQSTYSNNDLQLIVVFTERRRLGLTAKPYMAFKDGTDPKINLVEQITPVRAKNYGDKISEPQLQIIKVLDEISDQRLHKKYSRAATVKEFLDTITNELLEKRIRPDIEKRLTQCIELLSVDEATPAYFKSANYSQVYPDDKIAIPLLPSEAVFYFDLMPEHLEYTLKVRENGKDFGLLGRQLLFVTNDPCAFILNQKLYRFTDIDSKKLKPFLDKTAIRIASQSVANYMEKFVTNCVSEYQVMANGFDIVDKSGTASAVLNLEQDLAQQPVLALYFVYDDKRYLAGTTTKVFAEVQCTNNHYTVSKIERQKNWEQKITEKLAKLGLIAQNNCHFRPDDVLRDNPSITLHNLITWLAIVKNELDQAGITVEQRFFDKQYFLGPSDIIKEVEETKDWFDLKMVVKVGEFLIPFTKFKKHIASRTHEFTLPDGTIFVIPEAWFTRFADLLHFAKNGDDDNLQIDRTHFNLVQEAFGIELDSVRNLAQSLQPTTADLKAPNGLNATLRSYQLQGYFWMKQLGANNLGGILADDMGLGKTLQTISLLAGVYEANGHDGAATTTQQLSLFDAPRVEGFNKSDLPPSLIVMPTSLVHNWQNEIQKFAPSLKVYNYTGQNRLKTKDIGKIIRHYHVVITSYGVLRNDIEYIKSVNFQYLILDESQNIKNPSSKLYDVVMELQGHHRMVLTGTPIENSLGDLWAQLNFVNPGLLGSLNFFKNQFVNPIAKNQSEEHEKRLQALINPYILRRTKEAVATELPPITEQTLYCDMTPEQAKLYDSEKSGIRNKLLNIIAEKGVEKTGLMALQALTRLRQLANHPVMVDDSFKGLSGKFEQILENLESIVAEKHKVLVFSSFVKDLELIEKELDVRKLSYSKLTGATGNRQEVIKRFTANEECRIFLISLKAGGVGLNLTEADYVFMLNPWWNPAAELQAINRAHRIGQKRNVFVYRFISTGTIEEKIAKLQEKKQALADTFINSNNPFKNLSESEIRELFA
jgi:superfamily II DNA or RNA helicase